MRHIFHASLLRSFNYTTKHSTTQILSFVTFVVFIALHGILNLQIVSILKSNLLLLIIPLLQSTQVLVSLGLYTVLLLGAGLVFPYAVETVFQTFAALRRVQVSIISLCVVLSKLLWLL